mgnify:FL=1
MTKTLTEQWQEGKLKEGYYYTLLDTDSKMVEINYCWDDGCFQDYCDNMIDEVLAPVPSYDEWKESQKKRALWFDKYKIETYKLEQKIQELEKQIKEVNNLFLQIQKIR